MPYSADWDSVCEAPPAVAVAVMLASTVRYPMPSAGPISKRSFLYTAKR